MLSRGVPWGTALMASRTEPFSLKAGAGTSGLAFFGVSAFASVAAFGSSPDAASEAGLPDSALDVSGTSFELESDVGESSAGCWLPPHAEARTSTRKQRTM